MSSTKENQSQRIRQVLFTIDKTRTYKFDVNQTTTIKGLKRIITVAANLGKSGLRIFHKEVEYTDEDDSTLKELFPDQQLTEFTIHLSPPPVYDTESKIKLKLGDYCSHHVGKYLYFYCYDCSESICSACTSSDAHKNHKIIEKYDYLQSSKHLVDLIFNDMTSFISGVKNDKNVDTEELKKKIKTVYFPGLYDLIRSIENQMIELIDTMVDTSERSYNNFKQNVNLIKDHCSQGLDKLKEEIKIEEIMMDQEIFIVFDKKYKQIESEKNRIREDKKKFEELSDSFKLIGDTIEKIYHKIYVFLDEQEKNSVFSDLKKTTKDKSIELVKKDEIINKLLSDVKIRRTGKKSALSRNAKSTAPNLAYNSQIRQISPARDYDTDHSHIINSIFNFNYKEPEISPPKKVPQTLNQPIALSNVPSKDFRNSNILEFEKKTVEIEEKASIMNYSISNALSTPNDKSKIIMRCEKLTNDIILYEDETDTLGRITVNFPPFSPISQFLKNCSWINLKGKLYICGGQLDTELGSTSFLCYDYYEDRMTIHPDMIEPRFNHSMIYYNNAIYVVGGYKSNTCEKYDLKTMKWTKLSNLSVEERQNSVLFVQNNYLYSFFGYSIGSYLDSVEKLKLTNQKAKWEIVPYKNLDKINLKLIGCGFVRLDDHSVIFLGGRNNNEQRRQSFKFDFSTSTFSLTDIYLEDSPYFQESALEELSESSYGHFDNEVGDNFLKIQIN
jgi:hypothetical protein